MCTGLALVFGLEGLEWIFLERDKFGAVACCDCTLAGLRDALC